MSVRVCKACGSDYIQRGGDPELRMDECMPCELERLRAVIVEAIDICDRRKCDADVLDLVRDALARGAP